MKKVLICAGLIGLAVITSGFFGQEHRYQEVTYTVIKGDTLWQIAERNCGNTYILEYIDVLRERNPRLVETQNQIRPGDVLIIRQEVES